jgi:hypothetical protein
LAANLEISDIQHRSAEAVASGPHLYNQLKAAVPFDAF